MKRLVKKVELVFFQDDGNGEYGLAHKETFDQSNGSGFNAFWGGIGIFHDVFEHSHEHTNKYFRGDYAMNIGGEMTAMGAMMYYIDEMRIANRLRQNYFAMTNSNGTIMRESTLSEVHEAISSAYCNYGNELLCKVPYQKPVENSELEYQIEQYYSKVKELPVNDDSEEEKEFSRNYKKSVTFAKIANLHRYGYRMAKKLVGKCWDNRAQLYGFIEFWDNFCKQNKAQDLQNYFRGLTVYLYKDETGFITWKATFESSSPTEIKDVTVTEETRYFDLEDAWIPLEDEN